MDKKTEKMFEEKLKSEYKRQYSNGLLDGSVAMCGAILEKAENKAISEQERIEDIIKFCKTSLGKRRLEGKSENIKSQ